MSDDWEEETTSTEVSEIREQLASVGAGHTRPRLTVLTGSGAGALFKLSPGSVVIGRAANAEIKIDEEGISRAHARIRTEGHQSWIDDTGSRNGTYVNGAKLTARHQLREGDKIQVGRGTVLRFGYHDELDESFHENLMSSALRDGLTKLFNKRYFLERLDSELKFAQRHGTELSLLMLDLDHFKRVNDTLGHLAGDMVLSTVAAALARAVRNEDVVARFGGEEFAVVLRAIPVEQATGMADRLRRMVEATHMMFDNQDVRATVSIGIAGYPSTPAKTTDELVEAADKALYRAKDGGRNRVAR